MDQFPEQFRDLRLHGLECGSPLRRCPPVATQIGERARADYAVVASGTTDEPVIDIAASDAVRAELRSQRGEQPFFDRGPGYAALSGGATAAEVDWV